MRVEHGGGTSATGCTHKAPQQKAQKTLSQGTHTKLSAETHMVEGNFSESRVLRWQGLGL